MALASLDDINLFLPVDKIKVDTAKYVPFQLDAERIIRGYLAGYFTPATLATWVDPDSTPGLIRAIVGRIVAAFYYRERYAEDQLDDPKYAQNLYDTAMQFLRDIMAGILVVEEVTDQPTTDRLTSDDFWPNDTTEPSKFTMEMNL